LCTRTSSFVKILFISFAHFLTGSLISGELSFWDPHVVWLLIFCQTYSLQRLFTHYVGCIFNLESISLLCKSFLISLFPFVNAFSYLLSHMSSTE
jgi:hypothetical protein